MTQTGPYFNEIAASTAANGLKEQGYKRVAVVHDKLVGAFFIEYVRPEEYMVEAQKDG